MNSNDSLIIKLTSQVLIFDAGVLLNGPVMRVLDPGDCLVIRKQLKLTRFAQMKGQT